MLQWTFAVVCLTTWSSSSLAQTNNTVNTTSGVITWGELAPDHPYKTIGFTIDDYGLDPYYNLAKSFIDSSLPEELPIDTAKQILKDFGLIKDKWQDVLKSFIGFAICLFIGIVFIIVFPIVGCCFCCCRCCGNCGGKMVQKPDPRDKCKRTAFSIVVFILSIFVIAGAACMYVTSDQLSKNVPRLNSSFSDSVDDVGTFVDNINQQFQRLADTNFNFLSDILIDFVNTASDGVADRIVQKISAAVNLNDPLSRLVRLSDQALTASTALSNNISALEQERQKTVTRLQSVNTSCNGCVSDEIKKLEDLANVLKKMNDNVAVFQNQSTTNIFQSMKSEIDQKIQNNIKNATKDINVTKQFDAIYNDNIKPVLQRVSDLRETVSNSIKPYQDTVSTYVNTVEPYNRYRWIAGVVLASLLIFIAVLALLGVILGFLCGSAKDFPTERSEASNCGGISLMAAVGFIFIFGCLFMLLTTLMYIVGSISERYVCQTVADFSKIERYVDSLELGNLDLNNISFNINGQYVSTSLSKLMSGCQQGQTLYTVLQLNGIVQTALDKINDYKSDINISSKINASEVAKSVNSGVNLTSEIAALNETVGTISILKDLIVNTSAVVNDTKRDLNNKLPGVGDQLDGMIAILGKMTTLAGDMETIANYIQSNATLLPGLVQDAIYRLQNATFMQTLIAQVTGEFVNTIFGYVDSYITDVTTKLQNDVGKCTPVYYIKNAILDEALCHGIVDPLNGFWLALGWCIFFFVPSLIFSVKLAKYFRRMKYEDQYGNDELEPSAPPYFTHTLMENGGGKSPTFPHGNKVAPF